MSHADIQARQEALRDAQLQVSALHFQADTEKNLDFTDSTEGKRLREEARSLSQKIENTMAPELLIVMSQYMYELRSVVSSFTDDWTEPRTVAPDQHTWDQLTRAAKEALR